MRSPAPLPKPPEPTQEVVALQEELVARREAKSNALVSFKQTAERVAVGSPADSSLFKIHKRETDVFHKCGPEASGVRQAIPCPEERIAVREAQMHKAREERQNQVATLKRTASAAVTAFRETQLFDSDDLNERLANLRDSVLPPRPSTGANGA